MDTHNKIREHISTLVDDELLTDDLELALAALQCADGQQAWHIYHRIGDVLRAQAAPELSPEFAQRLGERLLREPAYGRQKAKAASTADKPAPRSAARQPARGASDKRARTAGSASGEPVAPAEAVAATTKPAIASVS